jgi:uncharacterized protein
MELDTAHAYTAFLGARRLASGSLEEVAAAAARASSRTEAALLVFSDATGSQVDLDLRGSEEEVRERHRPRPTAPVASAEATPRGRGRPRLGVVAREVTLLPQQWEWLAAQPGGASVALRKLVHQAQRAGTPRERTRQAQERSYKVMAALAGDRPGFEEASRALFAGDMPALRSRVERWPRDIREHVLQLADPEYHAQSRSAG